MFKRGWLMRKLIWLAAATVAIAGAGLAQAQDTPRKGGTIRMTAPYAASFGSLDPHTTPRAQDDIVNKALQRTLYNWDSANGKLVLELAKSVTPAEDGLTYTYKLRDDALFHNGRKMTADDIIWSFTRIMDGSKGYPAARYVRIIKGAIDVEKNQAKEISGLKKIDDFTLEMTITDRVEPGYYFFGGTTAIVPKEEVEKGNFATNPVGLGPFKFKEHIPGSRVVAERWEKFYKPGKPYADKLEVLIMAEAAARDVAFRNKEIDTSILGPAQYVAYRADPELSKGILEVAEMFTRSVQFNIAASKPFQDKRVRQAFNHAIDTDLIIKRLVKDKAYRATSWLPPSSAAFDKTVKPYAYDPEKAKKLLTDAGYPNGFEFELTTSQNESWGLPIVEAIIPMLAKVGIKLKPKLVEVTVLTEIAMKGEHEAYIGSSLTGPDSLATLRCYYSKTPRTACNYTSFSNPEFDKLLDAAAQEGDMSKRNDLLRQANNIVYEEAPVWFFNYNKAVLAHQPWIHGLQANPTEITHQYPEDVWVDERSPAK
jgi:peptide/nickel transport system substrate-binding protein